MKKIYSLLLTVLFTSLVYSQSTGIYDAYVILNINGGGLNYKQPSTNFNGTNLGTFSNTQSLIFAGGQNKTYKCNGGNVTGGNIYYRVYPTSGTPGTFTPLTMGWSSNDSGAGSGCQNQTWEINSNTTNLLSSLADGTYTLEVYLDAPGYPSTAYYSNNSNNFKASFTINNSTLGTIDVKNNGKKAIIANDKLFSTVKGELDITIVDASGRMINSFKANNTGNPIDLNTKGKGLYFVKVSQGNQTEIVKFTK